MLSSVNKSLSERTGKRLGFFVGLAIFSTLLFFVGLKFKIIPAGTSYYIAISLVILLHVIYSGLRVLVKK